VPPLNSLLEPENELSPESPHCAVKELSEPTAVQVVLYVSRIGMIEQVEYPESHFHRVLLTAKGQPELPEHLKVEGIKAPDSLVIPGTYELTPFIHNRVRESGVNIQYRH